jgi:hypothetical protein
LFVRLRVLVVGSAPSLPHATTVKTSLRQREKRRGKRRQKRRSEGRSALELMSLLDVSDEEVNIFLPSGTAPRVVVGSFLEENVNQENLSERHSSESYKKSSVLRSLCGLLFTWSNTQMTPSSGESIFVGVKSSLDV